MKKTPIYIAIAQALIDQIQNELLLPGDQLPTEAQLCEKYNVSRMTVNKALTTLVGRGYISRTAGKGSFVLEHRVDKNPAKNSSFSSDILSIHKKPGAILEKYEVVKAGEIPKIMRILRLSETDLVHYIYRVRTSNDVRIALSTTYIPCRILPALDVNALSGSLYEYLSKSYGIRPRAIDRTLSAVLPAREQLELLGIDSCAFLKSSHLSVTEDNKLMEYTETLYIGSRYTYHLPDEA